MWQVRKLHLLVILQTWALEMATTGLDCGFLFEALGRFFRVGSRVLVPANFRIGQQRTNAHWIMWYWWLSHKWLFESHICLHDCTLCSNGQRKTCVICVRLERIDASAGPLWSPIICTFHWITDSVPEDSQWLHADLTDGDDFVHWHILLRRGISFLDITYSFMWMSQKKIRRKRMVGNKFDSVFPISQIVKGEGAWRAIQGSLDAHSALLVMGLSSWPLKT